MNAEQSLKRPYSQNDADVDPSELPPYQANAGNEVDQSSQSLTDPETVPGKISRRATLRTCNQDRVETNAEEFSKRLCLDKIRLLDPRQFHHMHYTTSPCKAIRPSTRSQHRAMMTASALHPKQSVRKISTTTQSVY